MATSRRTEIIDFLVTELKRLMGVHLLLIQIIHITPIYSTTLNEN